MPAVPPVIKACAPSRRNGSSLTASTLSPDGRVLNDSALDLVRPGCYGRRVADGAGLDGLFASADPEIVRCPYPVYARARADHPVCWVESLSAFAVTRHADVLDVLLRPEDFSSTRQSGPGAATTLARAVADDPTYPDTVRVAAARRIGIAERGASLVNCDPPRHTEQRRLLNKVFAPRRVAVLEEAIAALADWLVDAFVGRGRADLVAELALPLPMTVIARALGVEGTELTTLKRWSDAFVRANGKPTLRREQIVDLLTAIDECYDFFTARLAERSVDPREDLISDVAAAGAVLRPEEQLQTLTLFLTGGNETTNSLIASCAWFLTQDQNLQEQVRAKRPGFRPSSRRCSAWSRRCRGCSGTRCGTPPSAACPFRPGPSSGCSTRRPTGTGRGSRTPTRYAWTAPPRGGPICRSRRGRTSASGRPWRVPRPGSRSRPCYGAPGDCAWPPANWSIRGPRTSSSTT
jgi:cytochrome P450